MNPGVTAPSGVDPGVVIALVRRTTEASGVPERLDDAAAAAEVAAILRASAS